VVIAFQKPEVGVLEVIILVPKFFIWDECQGRLVDSVNSVVCIEANKRIFNISEVVKLYLFHDEEMPLDLTIRKVDLLNVTLGLSSGSSSINCFLFWITKLKVLDHL
jgi:hypothetical protein